MASQGWGERVAEAVTLERNLEHGLFQFSVAFSSPSFAEMNAVLDVGDRFAHSDELR
ncbi:hypothetical protein GCM10008949_25100 [Deinococcus humi]|nr:hypothetical protein GCM10008949_25100 [Deinococcus humi]